MEALGTMGFIFGLYSVSRLEELKKRIETLEKKLKETGVQE
ncbi:hypothetical protein ACFL6P_03720 [Candidatus Latescibacterota bacterium]